MKKLFFALALVCSMQLAYAQKPDADLQKGVEKALEASKDAKKKVKPATWMNLGKAYMAAYANPTTNISTGIDKAAFSLMNKEKAASITNVTLQGATFEKHELSHVNVYFNQAGLLAIVEVTHPSVPGDLLGEAAAAYVKAFELGAKDKDVDPKLQEIVNDYYNDAFTAYQLGDLAKASDLFKGAADWSAVPPCSVRNDDAAYNCAFTALAIHNYDRAIEYYNKCLDRGFTSEGNIYASLSECALAKADTLGAKNYLATGLTQYPDNASILTNLINLYISTKEDPKKIVELLDEAKKAMPDNPSLYYVEGNIMAGVKDYEAAQTAYEKALVIDSKYDMAYYGLANIALKKGEDIVEQMNALDVRDYKKYDELSAQLTEVYIGALVPFEQCYNVSSNPDVKAACADYLKRLNFQLRGVDPKYKADYEKWEAIIAQ